MFRKPHFCIVCKSMKWRGQFGLFSEPGKHMISEGRDESKRISGARRGISRTREH